MSDSQTPDNQGKIDNDRVDLPSDLDDADALREYGRQLALDSLICDALATDMAQQEPAPTDTEGENVVPFSSTKRRFQSPIGIAAAACLAAMLVIAAWIFHDRGGISNVASNSLDPRWSLLPTGSADYEILAPDRVKLKRGELRFRSSQPAGLVVETPLAIATAQGTEFLIATHSEPIASSSLTEPQPENTMTRRELTRLLVLSGVVTIANDHGSLLANPRDAAIVRPNSAPEKIALQANSDFAFDLYAKLAQANDGKNLFFSPYSISNALLMVAEGARGKTAEEMGDALSFPESLRRTGNDAQILPWEMSQLHLGLADLNRLLNDDRKSSPQQRALRNREAVLDQKLQQLRSDPIYYYAKAEAPILEELKTVRSKIDSVELMVANAVWGDSSYSFADDWKTTVTQSYDTGVVQSVDFVHQAEAERQRINAWAEEKTQGQIRDLLPTNSVDSLTRLVLTNAVYFRAAWVVPFYDWGTSDQPFTLASGEEVPTPIMFLQDDVFRYAAFNADGSLFATPDTVRSDGNNPATYPDENGFAIAELPYRGDVTMVVILPNRADGLPALEAQIDAERVGAWIGALQQRETKLLLPKFETQSSFSLNEILQSMGMSSAFDENADFSGLTDSNDINDRLHLQTVVHKAAIEVNEQGTTAAAASAPAAGGLSAPDEIYPFVPEFYAKRPFLYLIRDTKSGAILFLGRMTQPTE